MFSERIQSIKPSPTIAMTGRAIALKAEGFPVLALSAGEPDFPTPPHICEAAIKAIYDGKTQYTQVEGIAALREAICQKMQIDHGLEYQANQVSVTSGAKQAIFNMMGALLNPGDEVVIPAPFWVSYPDMAMLFGAKPIFMKGNPANRLKIEAAALEAAITPKTKMLILNSPSNPTGVAYTREETQALGDVLERHPHVWICSDDIYEKTLWQGEFVNILMTNPKLKERTVIINGVSKAYAMTGWRIGYSVAPAALAKEVNKLQSQSTSNACSISQYAALAAISGDQSCIVPMVQAFKKRHDFLRREINALPGLEMLESDGAFYAFINVVGMMQSLNLKDDMAFANYLLEKIYLAGVPGSAFGMDGYIRFSFATSELELEETIKRLKTLF